MSAVLILLAVAGVLLWVLAPPAPAPAPSSPSPVRRASPAGTLDVARLVERLATVLGTGAGLRRAWAAVARSLPEGELAELARGAAGGSGARRAAPPRLRDTPMICSLDAALVVCDRTGAPAATVLTSLAAALRDLHEAAGARRTAFAGPRSTARILLVLPLVGLGLGALLGGDPLGVLLGTAPGRLLGLLGVALTVAGWVWMRRLLRRADPPRTARVDPSVLLDLVAGALASGLPLAAACSAVAAALDPGPDRTALDRLARALRAGVPAPQAADPLPADLRGLGESAALAEESGADLAGVLRSAARDLRRDRARQAEEAAARLGVSLVLPTGITLLPAFVVLGIVPTVASLLGGTIALVGA